MRRTATVGLSVALVLLTAPLPNGRAQEASATDAPQYTAEGKLKLPPDYREWIYLSSGLGMSYSDGGPPRSPRFDNVFVKAEAYRRFLKTGAWPDRTMFILELRQSSDHGSIVKEGRFQADVASIEASVKDERRFPEKWAYFSFGSAGKEAGPFAKEAGCFSCHQRHGAVDNTFVQFYPTLLDVANRAGAIRSDIRKE